MRILKFIGLGIVGLLVLIIAYVFAFAPDKGHVEQSVVINAPASVIFPHLNNMEKFVAWSPWSKMDPDAKNTYEGAAAGVGARMNWVGEKTGTGSQWVVESVENERVKTGVKFEGFEGTAWAEFKLAPEGDGTKVTWTYDGDNTGFMGKAMWSLFMGTMLDGQFADGLIDLKKLVESAPVETPTATPAPTDSTGTK
ncbi:MAG: SRPBCC family protein [Cyclobacteriaceae bacterium]|nr:SRPBCC family protein [Cyclobacteriaceae bacterium]